MTATWLASAGSASTADLVALRPDLASRLARFDGEASARLDPHLRALLEVRVAQLIGDTSVTGTADEALAAEARSWPTHPDVSETERGVLDLAESFVMDVHSVTDEQVARVQGGLGNEGTVAVLLNLALLDGFTKFRRVFTEADR